MVDKVDKRKGVDDAGEKGPDPKKKAADKAKEDLAAKMDM